jgi:hypothetical protein
MPARTPARMQALARTDEVGRDGDARGALPPEDDALGGEEADTRERGGEPHAEHRELVLLGAQVEEADEETEDHEHQQVLLRHPEVVVLLHERAAEARPGLRVEGRVAALRELLLIHHGHRPARAAAAPVAAVPPPGVAGVGAQTTALARGGALHTTATNATTALPHLLLRGRRVLARHPEAEGVLGGGPRRGQARLPVLVEGVVGLGDDVEDAVRWVHGRLEVVAQLREVAHGVPRRPVVRKPPSAPQEDDIVDAQKHLDAWLVDDCGDGQPRAREPVQVLHQLLRRGAVQPRGGLIEEEDQRLARQLLAVRACVFRVSRSEVRGRKRVSTSIPLEYTYTHARTHAPTQASHAPCPR